MLGAIRDQLMEEAGFALVEALSMEGVLEAEEFVIKVVTEFVQEGPQEGPKGHHLTALRRAHPHSHLGRHSILGWCVQAMQFTPGPGRAFGEDFDLDGRHAESARQAGYECLGNRLSLSTVLTF